MKRHSSLAGAAALGLILAGSFPVLSAGVTPFWKTIRPGPFGVGYAVYHERDETRAYRPADDRSATDVQPPRARPIQISVWYPALPVDDAEPLDLVEYSYAALSQFDASREGAVPLEVFVARTKEALARGGADERSIDEMLRAPAVAVAGAPPAAGPFPCIVYGTGYESSAWENFVLCEYLASNGFIVASSPSFGANGVRMTDAFQDLEAKVRDHEFVIAFAKRLPGADASRIGAVGWSYGGLSTAILAMRGRFVDAVACLDGSMAYPAGRAAAERHPDYRPAALEIPFLYCSRKDAERADFGFFDELVHADRLLVEFAGLAHEDFAARPIVSDLCLGGKAAPRDAARAIAGYEEMCRFTLAFFRATLLGDSTSAGFDAGKTSGGAAVVRRGKALQEQGGGERANAPDPAAGAGFERFAGEYEAEGIVARIEIDGRRLSFRVPGAAPHEYVHERGRTFRHAKYGDFTLVFLVGTDGAVTGAVSHQGYADFVLKRR
ncbi:MAG: hypothetical protein C4574_02315 [Candidatus Latescibacterota bacterium]|jgi:hypothetical protein|nr:MAG: hypothetical protein C4574_02315 [Candidatus Latescibacterota bacterium]